MSDAPIRLTDAERQALRALRDCGVIRAASIGAARPFWGLIRTGLARERWSGAIINASPARLREFGVYVDFRLTAAGKAMA